MVEYNKVNVKLTDSQLNKLKSYCRKSNRSNLKNKYENV